MPTPPQQLLETLRRVPLFNELSERELGSIVESVTTSRYEANQIVFSEGDQGGDLLIIREGDVKIVKMAASGRHQLISIERPGSSLGEVSLFDGGPYSTTAITMNAAVLLRVRGEHFRNLCLIHPHLALKVIRVLGHRLRHLRQLVEQLSFATVRERLIAHLLRLADERGIRGEAGIEISLDENNEELAARHREGTHFPKSRSSARPRIDRHAPPCAHHSQ